jgi:hypothetical protein
MPDDPQGPLDPLDSILDGLDPRIREILSRARRTEESSHLKRFYAFGEVIPVPSPPNVAAVEMLKNNASEFDLLKVFPLAVYSPPSVPTDLSDDPFQLRKRTSTIAAHITTNLNLCKNNSRVLRRLRGAIIAVDRLSSSLQYHQERIEALLNPSNRPYAFNFALQQVVDRETIPRSKNHFPGLGSFGLPLHYLTFSFRGGNSFPDGIYASRCRRWVKNMPLNPTVYETKRYYLERYRYFALIGGHLDSTLNGAVFVAPRNEVDARIDKGLALVVSLRAYLPDFRVLIQRPIDQFASSLVGQRSVLADEALLLSGALEIEQMHFASVRKKIDLAKMDLEGEQAKIAVLHRELGEASQRLSVALIAFNDANAAATTAAENYSRDAAVLQSSLGSLERNADALQSFSPLGGKPNDPWAEGAPGLFQSNMQTFNRLVSEFKQATVQVSKAQSVLLSSRNALLFTERQKSRSQIEWIEAASRRREAVAALTISQKYAATLEQFIANRMESLAQAQREQSADRANLERMQSFLNTTSIDDVAPIDVPREPTLEELQESPQAILCEESEQQ